MTDFSADQYAIAYPDGAERHWWHLARNRIVERAIRAAGKASAPILDVGCGRGIVVRHLRDRGLDARGVELGAATPLDGVEEHIRIGAAAEDLPRGEREPVETILLLDVVEHLPDPAPFLQNLASAFPRLSHVIVTLPARPELWSNHDEFYGHYRRYTIPKLAEIAEALHADCTFRSYFFRAVYPPAWLMAKLKMQRETALAPPRALWLHRLVAALCVLEYTILPRRLGGTSIVATFALRD